MLSLPGSNALYGSSTVLKEQGPLHRRPDVVKSKQGFPHFRERVWVKKLVHDRRIRFGTWNIGTLTGKSMEIVDVMVRRKINFMCLQETKWTGEKAKELDNLGFKLWYTGKIRSKNGVGIIVDKEWKKDVVDVRRVGDRIIVLKLVVGQDTFNVISGYAPQVGLAEHFKVKFWEDLEGVLQDILQGEKVFLGGDLNGHVGSVARGFEGVHGGFGLGEMNGEDLSSFTGSGIYPDLSSFIGSGVYPDLSSFTGSGVYPDLSSFIGSGVYRDLSSFTGSGVIQNLRNLYQAIRCYSGSHHLVSELRLLIQVRVLSLPKWRRTKAQVEKDKAPEWRRMKAQVEKDEGPEAETLSRLLITYQGNPCGVYPDLSSFTGSGVYPDLSSFTGSGVYPDLSSFTGSGKREEHLITYKSGGTCSQIDFFLIRKSDRKYCLNCKVIPGESLTTQHRVLVMDVRIRDRAKRRSPLVAPRIKWWHLKGEKQGIFQQKIWEDDIVLLGESREELNERLETWRRALETHGFRLSRSKSEYMECKFNKRRRVSNSEVKIGDHIIPQVTRFKYLGSVIQDDGEIEGDVNHRIQAGWMKWRKASEVLCDAKVPIKLKGKFYRTAVRPAILYGTECWAVKSQLENKVGVAEMRMLRWMCGKTRQDKIRNEAIRERVGVAPIVEKMVENRLRWFGHVERRPVDSVVRRVDQMERRQTIRGRGRPKKTIREVIKKDLEINGLDRSMGKAAYNIPPPYLRIAKSLWAMGYNIPHSYLRIAKSLWAMGYEVLVSCAEEFDGNENKKRKEFCRKKMMVVKPLEMELCSKKRSQKENGDLVEEEHKINSSSDSSISLLIMDPGPVSWPGPFSKKAGLSWNLRPVNHLGLARLAHKPNGPEAGRGRLACKLVLFLQVWKIQGLLMSCARDEDEVIKRMAEDMMLKFDKYWDEYSVVLAFGAVFYPRIKFESLGFCYKKIDPLTWEMKVEKVKRKLYKLWNFYAPKTKSSSSSVKPPSSSQDFGIFDGSSKIHICF
ncbi:Craniofacial development protein 2 [Glycine soja]